MGIGTLRRRKAQIAARRAAEAEAQEAEQEAPRAPAAPAADVGRPEAQLEGWSVAQNGTWFSLISPEGEKVGKSQRTEEDAWALLEEVDDAE